MRFYLDKSGKEISIAEASILFGNEAYRRIDITHLPDESFISTVWLGIDHSFGGNTPLIFETMSYEKGGWVECERYATEEEARKGHKEVVKRVHSRLFPKT